MKTAKTKKREVQSIFSGGSLTCPDCKMTYSVLESDKRLHERYHTIFVNGLPWKRARSSSGNEDSSKQPVRSYTLQLSPSVSSTLDLYVVDGKSINYVKKVEQLISMANSELNATPISKSWYQSVESSQIQGKAFVAVFQNRAVAICITDPITDADKQCRWLRFNSQKVVENQVNRAIKIGISRIWTVKNFRRKGIAMKLLQAVQDFSIYGMKLHPREIAFSQPSSAGSHLTKKFNSVQHKSGEILIPVYIEL